MDMRARDNPFRVQRLGVLPYRPQQSNWPDMMRQLQSLHGRAAIVGHRGSGKTTLLESLQQRLKASGQAVRLMRVAPCLSLRQCHIWLGGMAAPEKHEFLLLDSAENLSWRAWRALQKWAKPAAGLVTTQHRAGRLPTWVCCTTSPRLLGQLVGELTSPEFALSMGERIENLYHLHSGNLRAALLAIYDDPRCPTPYERNHSHTAASPSVASDIGTPERA